jgi:hypothetical protein
LRVRQAGFSRRRIADFNLAQRLRTAGSLGAIVVANSEIKFFESTPGPGRISLQKPDHTPDEYNLTYFKPADANLSRKRIDSFDPAQ